MCFFAAAKPLAPHNSPGGSAMPRVVPDQKAKYETDELFKKLSQDTDVSVLFPMTVSNELMSQSII